MLLRPPFAPRDVERAGTPYRIPSFLADVAVLLGTLALFALIARVGAGAFVRFVPPHEVPTVSLEPRYLPYYAARSTLRMFLALGASLLFSMLYGYSAAKSRRAEQQLIPLLDIQPSLGAADDTSVRPSAVWAGAGLLIHHCDGVHCPLSWQFAWSRAGVSLRHLHQPGLEHDVLVLPVATDGATGIGRGRHALSPAALAAISAPGGAGGDHRAAVERHDELWRRLVLCRCQRGHQCAEPVLHLARHWLVCHHCCGGAGYTCLAVGTGGHSGGHHSGGPTLLAAPGGVG